MINILLIDDEKDFGYFVKANLQLGGRYDVAVATNGKKGISLARKHKPDLILLDIMMPKTDGFEVLKRLKEDEKTMPIPVIMLTAKDDDEYRIKATGLYCDDYIVKPVGLEPLQSKIETILRRKAGR